VTERDDLAVQELDVPTCLAYLRSATIGRVAFLVDGQPIIIPVNYAIDRGTVLFHSAEGSKLRAGLASAPMAFEADGRDADTGAYWSVLLQGRAEVVRRPDDLEDVEGVDTHTIAPGDKRYTMRIDWSSMTGRLISGANAP
jgi:nitroimidazol reductase NimA-like FMN-containing flavoprotein (pyridoxamine 5'-phosphate oxidase superfamily)